MIDTVILAVVGSILWIVVLGLAAAAIKDDPPPGNDPEYPDRRPGS